MRSDRPALVGVDDHARVLRLLVRRDRDVAQLSDTIVSAKTDWTDFSGQMSANGTTLAFVWGDADWIGDTRYAQQWTAIQVRVVEGAGHNLPGIHAQLSVSELLSI